MSKLILVLSVMSAIFLTACDGHKNPLINNETISWLKADIENSKFLENNTIIDCGAYYAGHPDSKKINLKENCEAWSKEEFKSLQQVPSTPKNAKIEDLRDPALWNIVTPRNGN